jgi:hypothetical protein
LLYIAEAAAMFEIKLFQVVQTHLSIFRRTRQTYKQQDRRREDLGTRDQILAPLGGIGDIVLVCPQVLSTSTSAGTLYLNSI